MNKEHFKSEILFNQPDLNIDRAAGRIKNVVIIQEGLCKNGDLIDTIFLSDLVDLAKAQTKGVKSRFGHPNMCKSSLGSFIGRFFNYQVVNEDQKYKVLADLELDPITKKTQVEGQGISMFEYLMDMAENNSDVFGTSIHFTGTGEPHMLENGKEVNKPKILGYIASDVVDSPAATDNLFKDSNDFGITVTRFLDENPEIFEVVKSDQSIIETFIKKYEDYTKSKNEMGILENLKKKMQGKKDVNLTLAEGEIVTVVTGNEYPEVGDAITDEAGAPLADGEYVDKDGNTIKVADGKITAWTAPEEEEVEEEKEKAPVTEDTKSTDATLQEILKNSKDNASALELMAETIGSMKSEINTLKKSITSKPFIAPDKTERKGLKSEGEETIEAKIAAQKEAREAAKK